MDGENEKIDVRVKLRQALKLRNVTDPENSSSCVSSQNRHWKSQRVLHGN